MATENPSLAPVPHEIHVNVVRPEEASLGVSTEPTRKA
jgi:hypothetical protein